jgi:hypothetical protein
VGNRTKNDKSNSINIVLLIDNNQKERDCGKSRLYVHAFSLSRSYFQVFEELVIQKYKLKLPKKENYIPNVESSTDVLYLKIGHDGV